LWVVPFFAVLLYVMVSRTTERIGDWLMRTGRIDEAASFHGIDMAGARSVLETIITLNI
jgi:ribose/xylose/arabinose/galactoside ABC-type transport system permease subunit